jgi:hypothetical protein
MLLTRRQSARASSPDPFITPAADCAKARLFRPQNCVSELVAGLLPELVRSLPTLMCTKGSLSLSLSLSLSFCSQPMLIRGEKRV